MRPGSPFILLICLLGISVFLWTSASDHSFRLREALRISRPSIPASTSGLKAKKFPPVARIAGHTPEAQPRQTVQLPSKDSSHCRLWNTNFLASLRDFKTNDSIQFALADEGSIARGQITRLEKFKNEVVYVAGRLTEPAIGSFFFQKQTRTGLAGGWAGVVEFPALLKAYRIEPTGPDRLSELVERPLNTVLCLDLPRARHTPVMAVQPRKRLAAESLPAKPIPVYQKGVVSLESLPGAGPVIYLDFQGGSTPTWGGVTYDRPDLSNSEISEIWERVSEDYRPFEVNVTTDLEKFQQALEGSRQRVIITPTDTALPGTGGATYLNSFNWTGDTPSWVFETSHPKYCAEACSHEAGHALGLSHEGQFVNGAHSEYYYGHGEGDTSWAPIMGVPYNASVTQWSKGEYIDANNTQDQLAIIASQNGMRYRTQESVDTGETTRYLDIYGDGTARSDGQILTPGASNSFQFITGGGKVALGAQPFNPGANLALTLTLADAGNVLLASRTSTTDLGANLDTNLPAGTYVVRITGSGRNSPLTNGFSSYGSLGLFSITGTVANARPASHFSIPENSPIGTVVGAIIPSNTTITRRRYSITHGNTGNAFTIDNAGIVPVANKTPLDYEALSGDGAHGAQIEFFVDIFDLDNPLLNEVNARVVVAITNINESPVVQKFVAPVPPFSQDSFLPPLGTSWVGSTGLLTLCIDGGCHFASSVLEHSPLGGFAGRLIASDPDYGDVLLYSILTGNSNGMFRIDSQTGTILVAGDLVAAVQNVYHLTVAVSDQAVPSPLIATADVIVTVQLPYRRGSISRAEYPNIPGAGISALINDFKFPFDPASETQLSSFETGSAEAGNDGTVIRGYLLPPVSGIYTFWIASRDESELWLSSSTNRASMERIAYLSAGGAVVQPHDWTNYPSQMAHPISLAAGYAYYIEARTKTGTSTGYVSVAWECAEAGLRQQVIQGEFLAPYFMNYVPRASGFSATLHQNAIGGARAGRVLVTDLNPGDLETFSITAGNDEGLFAIDSQSGVIRLSDAKALSLASQTNYQLRVEVTDSGVPVLSAFANANIEIVPANAILTPFIQQEIWTNLGSSALINDLIGQARFPKRPDLLRPLGNFDSGRGDFGTNYGSRIRAYITPINTGNYTFFIASDGQSQLKLSFNGDPGAASIIASATDPAGYQEWTRQPSQMSSSIGLQAGQRYYLEALQTQIAGPGHVEVAWAGPGLVGTNVIDSSVLSPVDLEYPPDFAGTGVNLSFEAEDGKLVTTLTTTKNSADEITYRIISGNLSNTFAIDPDSGRLSVANNGLFNAYSITNFSLVVEAQSSGYGGIYPLKSSRATVFVHMVDQAPAYQWSGLGPDANWSSGANWLRGNPPAEGAKITFAATSQHKSFNDTLTRVGLVQIYPGTFQISGNPLTLRGGITSVGTNEWRINSSLEGNQTISIGNGELTIVGALENNSYTLTCQVNNRMVLNNVVSGRGGLVKTSRGKLIVSRAATYTGDTLLQGGSLVLTNSGSIASSGSITLENGAVFDGSSLGGSFVIPPNQTLSGAGTVLGALAVQGTLLPQGMGFSSNVTLSGHVTVTMNYHMEVAGDLIYGGTLTFTNSNTNPNLPALGDSFRLFAAKHFIGSFRSAVLPSLKRGLAWDTSQLNVDGSLSVVAGEPRLILANTSVPSLSIKFDMASGVNYAVESSSSTHPPFTWDLVETLSGHANTVTVPLPFSPTDPQRLFRVRVTK